MGKRWGCSVLIQRCPDVARQEAPRLKDACKHGHSHSSPAPVRCSLTPTPTARPAAAATPGSHLRGRKVRPHRGAGHAREGVIGAQRGACGGLQRLALQGIGQVKRLQRQLGRSVTLHRNPRVNPLSLTPSQSSTPPYPCTHAHAPGRVWKCAAMSRLSSAVHSLQGGQGGGCQQSTHAHARPAAAAVSSPTAVLPKCPRGLGTLPEGMHVQ